MRKREGEKNENFGGVYLSDTKKSQPARAKQWEVCVCLLERDRLKFRSRGGTGQAL